MSDEPLYGPSAWIGVPADVVRRFANEFLILSEAGLHSGVRSLLKIAESNEDEIEQLRFQLSLVEAERDEMAAVCKRAGIIFQRLGVELVALRVEEMVDE